MRAASGGNEIQRCAVKASVLRRRAARRQPPHQLCLLPLASCSDQEQRQQQADGRYNERTWRLACRLPSALAEQLLSLGLEHEHCPDYVIGTRCMPQVHRCRWGTCTAASTLLHVMGRPMPASHSSSTYPCC